MKKEPGKPEKKQRILTAVFTALIAALFLLSLTVIVLKTVAGRSGVTDPADGRIAYIYSDGKQVMRIDLTASEDRTFVITGKNGGTNMICISDHDICVLEASCPDRICVHQGFSHVHGLPIVCLPNRLVITVTGSATGKEGDDYDAVTY